MILYYAKKYRNRDLLFIYTFALYHHYLVMIFKLYYAEYFSV